jgi:leader peptidase (prepilin peptidase)/N-methyltransferase
VDHVELDLAQQMTHGPFGWVAAGLWGLVWGSFFNVLIVRLPGGESVVKPASHCRGCKKTIPWYDNIPILSYLLLRGRCRHCGERFSPRYLLVELLVLCLTLGAYTLLVVQQPDPLGLRIARFVIASLFCGVLVAITFIDLYTMRIPDAITYPGIPACMLLSLFMGNPHLWDGAVGGVAGYLVIRLIADGYELITGRAGMGYGDAKLLAMIGGLLGWQILLPTLFLSALQGSVIGITALVLTRGLGGTSGTGPQEGGSTHTADEPPGATPEDDEHDAAAEAPSSLRYTRIPFGPFLSLAAVEVLFLRQYLPVFFPYLW